MSIRRTMAVICLSVFALIVGGCALKKAQVREFTVLIRMMPAQERFFTEKIIREFEKQKNCKIIIAQFNNEQDIERFLKLDAGKKKTEIGLVKTPFELTRELVEKGYLKPLTSIIDSAQAIMDMAEYHPLATGLGIIDGIPYYIPRKLETRVLFYRKSMVADAVSKFDKHKQRIDKELKAKNGFGLPGGYVLEANPAQWDFYDMYVVGSIWANEEYNGVKMGRLAHRGARYGGTALDLIDRSLQLGATKDDILRLVSDKTVGMYEWEYRFIKDGLYNQGMWQDLWKGANLYNGIKDGKVFCTYVQQIDCFLIHGWPDDPAMASYLPQIDDMGICVVPKAVSFELDSKGAYAFEGTRSISTGGWWWGIPKTSPNAVLAYDLARFITSRENNAVECSKFGMIPVRKDILSNLPQVFDEGWVGEIFKVSIEQMQQNELTTVPLIKQYNRISLNFIEAWYKLCVEEPTGTFTSAALRAQLQKEFEPAQKEILGSDFPAAQ